MPVCDSLTTGRSSTKVRVALFGLAIDAAAHAVDETQDGVVGRGDRDVEVLVDLGPVAVRQASVKALPCVGGLTALATVASRSAVSLASFAPSWNRLPRRSTTIGCLQRLDVLTLAGGPWPARR